jgi:hypothetical protein
MSNARPADYSTTDVRVTTFPRATVTTTAHYKTKNTVHSTTSNASGVAVVPYEISGATPGYRVIVIVSARSGSRTATCSTSFTPIK